jgi:hypothetical protein
MTAPITFVPTPLLDYTEKYNAYKDNLRLYRQTQQNDEDRNERLRLEKYQDEQRMLEKRLLAKELEDVRMYSALAKQRGINDYKYAYWVGTLVDQYI